MNQDDLRSLRERIVSFNNDVAESSQAVLQEATELMEYRLKCVLTFSFISIMRIHFISFVFLDLDFYLFLFIIYFCAMIFQTS
jgi:hypothetical protein